MKTFRILFEVLLEIAKEPLHATITPIIIPKISLKNILDQIGKIVRRVGKAVLPATTGAVIVAMPYISGCHGNEFAQNIEDIFKEPKKSSYNPDPEQIAKDFGASYLGSDHFTKGMNPNQKQGWQNMSNSMRWELQRQAQRKDLIDAARAGRSEVNVNINQGRVDGSNGLEKTQYYQLLDKVESNGSASFIWNDRDNDDKVDISSKAREILPTNFFYEGDRISLIVRAPKYCKSIASKIVDKRNGKVVGSIRSDYHKPNTKDTFKAGHISANKIKSKYEVKPKGVVVYELRTFRDDNPVPIGINHFSISFDE